MATITVAGLRLVFPEWEHTPADVITHAVAVANARPLGLYTDRSVTPDENEEIHRRYLEASMILFGHPFSRDMMKTRLGESVVAINPYAQEIQYRDRLKGSLYRAPGWPDPGISET